MINKSGSRNVAAFILRLCKQNTVNQGMWAMIASYPFPAQIL